MDTNAFIPTPAQGQPGLPTPTRQRPAGLTLLCILSFIGSGINALTYLVMAANLNTVKDLLLYSDTYAELYESVPGMEAAINHVVSLGPGFFWIQTLLYLMSLAGVICMFRRIYAGFHIYTVAQCLLILWNMSQTGWGVPYGSIFLSGAFVALYALFLPYLRNRQPLPPYDPNGEPDGGNTTHGAENM